MPNRSAPPNRPTASHRTGARNPRTHRRRRAAGRLVVCALVLGGAFVAGAIGWTLGRQRQHPAARRAPAIATPAERTSAETKNTADPTETRTEPSPKAVPDSHPLTITQVERLQHSFNPSAGETTTIRFELSRPADITVNIHGPNRELIATLLDGKATAAGMHTVDWDGRDWGSHIVPDEAYTIRILAIKGEDTALWDPYLVSGGTRVTAGGLATPADDRFLYQLPKACRVLVRAAVEKGPLVRTVVNWEPRTAGLCIEEWDGMDADGLRRVADIQDVRVGVMAFTLPDKSIITSGNEAGDYRFYYHKFGRGRPHLDAVPRVKTDEGLISPHWIIPPHLNRDPRLSMEFVGLPSKVSPDTNTAVTQSGDAGESTTPESSKRVPRLVKNGEPILVRVDMPEPLEKAFVDDQRFELIVYVDDRRIIEVEQGHLPFTYPWDISDLEAGSHTLTINVSTFRNHVGTTTRIVNIVDS